MASVVATVVSGLLAKAAAKKILIDVLFSAALDVWSKKRAKKAAQRRAQDSYIQQLSQGPTSRVAAGNPVPVVFGTAYLQADIFDSLTPSDGGWPVYGAAGLCRPKDFTLGVDLLNIITGSQIAEQMDGFIDSINTPTIYNGIRIGNDPKKKATNMTVKYFPRGGFSSSTGITALNIGNIGELFESTRSAIVTTMIRTPGISVGLKIPVSSVGGIPPTAGDEIVFLKPDGSIVVTKIGHYLPPPSVIFGPGVNPNDLAVQRELQLYFQRNAGIGVFWQTLSNGRSLVRIDVAASSSFHSQGYRIIHTGAPPLDDTFYWMSLSTVHSAFQAIHFFLDNTLGAKTIENYFNEHPTTQFPAGTQAFLWRYNGVAKQPDAVFQQALDSNLQSNNHLAYIAVEVKDPGLAQKEIVHGVPSLVALIRDRAMPYATTHFTVGNGFVATSEMWKNPAAIIFEILVNENIGLGLSVSERINLPAFADFFNKCEALDSNGQKNWQIDSVVLSDRVEAISLINEILEVVHGAYYDDGKFTPILFSGNDSVVLNVNLDNITRKQTTSKKVGDLNFKMQYQKTKERYNRLNVRYVEPSRDYVADYYLSIVDYTDRFFNSQDKEKNVDMVMFHNSYYAKKSALMRMDRERKENTVFEFTMGVEGLDLKLGDVVRLQAFGSSTESLDLNRDKAIQLKPTVGAQTKWYIHSKSENFIITVGSTITFDSTEFVIEDGGEEYYNGVMTEYVVVNTAYEVPTISNATLHRNRGIKQLLNDILVRVIEIKMTPEFDVSITARKFDPDSYDIGNTRFTIIEPRLPDLRQLATYDQQPPKPIFTHLEIETWTQNNGEIRRRLIFAIGARNFPSVETTVVRVFIENLSNYYDEAEDENVDIEGQVGTVTLYRGDDTGYLEIPMSLNTGDFTDYRVYALAVSYNRNFLPSDEADSRDDILDADLNTRYPVTSTTNITVPIDAEFLTAECVYGNVLRIISKVYDIPMISGIELRKDDVWNYFSDTDADSNFVGRYKRQVIFEQAENLPSVRSLNFYIRAFNSVGNYSSNSGSITVTDSIPIQIPTGNIETIVSGNTVFINITPYNSGNYESDVIKYSVWNSAGDVKLTESSVPRLVYTVPYSQFGDSDTYELTFRVMAHDRLTDTLADGIQSNPITVTLEKLATASFQLDTLRKAVSRQLFRLDEWGNVPYSLNQGEQMILDATQGYSFLQEKVLDPSTEYTVSVFLQKVSGTDPVQLTISGPVVGSPLVISHTTTGLTYYALKFTTTSASGPIPPTVFTVSSTEDSIVSKLMLNYGDLALGYLLHPDDQAIPERVRQVQNEVFTNALTMVNNLREMNQNLIQQGTEITQNDFNISLRVRKDRAVSEINLSPEGVSISGRKIIIDGETVFINTTGNYWGTFVSQVDTNVWDVQVNSLLEMPSSGTIYMLLSAGATINDNDTFSSAITFTKDSVDPQTGYVRITVTSGTPIIKKFFINSNSFSVTRIDGGRIIADTIETDHLQANSIIASKIAAQEIGADKLIAKEIIADVIKLYGANNIVIDPAVGIFIFHNNNIFDNSTLYYTIEFISTTVGQVLTASLSQVPAAGDFMYISDSSNPYNGVMRKILSVGTSGLYTTFTFDEFSVAPGTTKCTFILKSVSTGSYIKISIDGTGVPSIEMYSGTIPTPAGTKWTPTGFSLKEGSIDIGSGSNSFHVDNTGNMWFGADLLANAKWSVNSDGTMKVGTGNNSFNVDNAGNMWIGHTSKASAPFAVDNDGSVSAATLTLANLDFVEENIVKEVYDNGFLIQRLEKGTTEITYLQQLYPTALTEDGGFMFANSGRSIISAPGLSGLSGAVIRSRILEFTLQYTTPTIVSGIGLGVDYVDNLYVSLTNLTTSSTIDSGTFQKTHTTPKTIPTVESVNLLNFLSDTDLFNIFSTLTGSALIQVRGFYTLFDPWIGTPTIAVVKTNSSNYNIILRYLRPSLI